MLWIPGAGLKPFGISYREKNRFGVTVRKVGRFTEGLFTAKPGDWLGIQGPYGNCFSGSGEKVAIVGGGYGTAPLAFLAEEMEKAGKDVFFITGAASKDFILFRERMKGKRIRRSFTTDDGSFGSKGFCTDCLSEIAGREEIDYVYSCGPEKMMLRVMEICSGHGIPGEFSVERYMKCGFGICGSCCLDGTGWRVCRDGPVFTLEQMGKIAGLGKWKRSPSGSRVDI
jgi:dihydroorotate dehydrogenase electron transfer subunit